MVSCGTLMPEARKHNGRKGKTLAPVKLGSYSDLLKKFTLMQLQPSLEHVLSVFL